MVEPLSVLSVRNESQSWEFIFSNRVAHSYSEKQKK